MDAVTQNVIGKDSATHVFLMAVPESTIENLVFQINIYIQQKRRRVKYVDIGEMHVVLGLQFLFGYHQLPHTRHYWSSDTDIGSIGP